MPEFQHIRGLATNTIVASSQRRSRTCIEIVDLQTKGAGLPRSTFVRQVQHHHEISMVRVIVNDDGGTIRPEPRA